MRSTNDSARKGGNRKTSIALVLGTALAFAACSKKESSGPPAITSAKPTVGTVVHTEWGAAPGQLGHNVPEEGLPEGPKSFVVDAAGTLHVLDQENGRIQRFANGKAAGTADLPPRTFDDIELDGASGYALLDLHTQPAIVFIDANGSPTKEVPLESVELPEPSLVTGLNRYGDGFYVEVNDEYLVRVADASGAALEPNVVPGQALQSGVAVKVESTDARHLSVYRVPVDEGEPSLVTDVGFDEDVGVRTLVAPTKSGGLLLAVELAAEQTDPEAPPKLSHWLVALGATGNESYRLSLPVDDGALDVFRKVRRGEDGNVYVMTTSADGVEIAKVTP